jgi:hypothetical protein
LEAAAGTKRPRVERCHGLGHEPARAFGALSGTTLANVFAFISGGRYNGDAQSNEDLNAPEAGPGADLSPPSKLIVEETKPGAFG